MRDKFRYRNIHRMKDFAKYQDVFDKYDLDWIQNNSLMCDIFRNKYGNRRILCIKSFITSGFIDEGFTPADVINIDDFFKLSDFHLRFILERNDLYKKISPYIIIRRGHNILVIKRKGGWVDFGISSYVNYDIRLKKGTYTILRRLARLLSTLRDPNRNYQFLGFVNIDRYNLYPIFLLDTQGPFTIRDMEGVESVEFIPLKKLKKMDLKLNDKSYYIYNDIIKKL